MAAPIRTTAAVVAAVHVADLDLSDSEDAPSSASAAAEPEVPNYAPRYASRYASRDASRDASASFRSAAATLAAVNVADIDLRDNDSDANVATVTRGSTSASAEVEASATAAHLLAQVLSNHDLGSLIIEFAAWDETPHLANLQAVSSVWRHRTLASSKLVGTCGICAANTVASRCAGTRKKRCQKCICYRCNLDEEVDAEDTLSECQGCRKRLVCEEHFWFCNGCDEVR